MIKVGSVVRRYDGKKFPNGNVYGVVSQVSVNEVDIPGMTGKYPRKMVKVYSIVDCHGVYLEARLQEVQTTRC